MARTSTAGTKNGVAGKAAFDAPRSSTGTRTAETTRPGTVAETKPAGAGAPQARPASSSRPTQEQIGRRAYEIYLDRCQRGQPGSAQSDWIRAEAELM